MNWNQEIKFDDPALQKALGYVLIVVVVVVMVSITSAISDQATQRPPDAVRGAYPEPSSWDGVTKPARSWFNTNLNDPKSMKVIDVTEVIKLEDSWGQRVRFRAKNAFGAYVINEYFFQIRHGQLVAVVPLE